MKKRRNMKRNWKDDMEEEKIKKGQALLTMKIKAEKHLHLRDPDDELYYFRSINDDSGIIKRRSRIKHLLTFLE